MAIEDKDLPNDVDVARLVRDIKAVALEITALKRCLRQPWQGPMAAQQEKLVFLKRQATGLCVLRAWLRRRYHLVTQPHDNGVAAGVWGNCWYGVEPWDKQKYALRVVAQLAPDYQRPPCQSRSQQGAVVIGATQAVCVQEVGS